MKKTELAVLTGLIMAIFLTQFTVFANNCNEVRTQTFRLHVLANSNSTDDQALKLAVRDELLLKYADSFKNAKNLEQAKDIASGLLYAMEYTAKSVVKEHGYDYNVNVSVENIYFKSGYYEGFTLPAGEYDALRVEIGSAEGENWFCVLYPALCIPAASYEQGMEIFSEDQKNLVESEFTAKFALFELYNNVINN